LTRPRRLVVGLGNPLLGEDGFGHGVIEWLRLRPGFSARAELLDAHTDLLESMETLGSSDEVVLVDVVVGAGHSRAVGVVDDATFMQWPETSPNCHQMSPLLAVKLFRALHPEARTRMTLVALYADELRIGSSVTPSAVEAGGEAVVRLLG
jgi:hydrogenase maturation protease